MATTAKSIVPDTRPKGQKRRKPLSKATKAKLAAALANWRASLTDEDRAALAERTREASRVRWEGKTAKEKAAAMAGVKAWQAQQRAAKRAAAKAAPKPEPKRGAKPKAAKPSPADSVGESAARKGRTRKAAAK